MNPWHEARRILPLEGAKIVTVGLISGTKILTGQRRDNGKWTSPGGHMDEGETLVEAAIREVKEESGITLEPSDLTLVSAERVPLGRGGKPFSVFCFTAKVPKERASSKDDPDKEISTWKWVELSLMTPELRPAARHAVHDSVLCYLGICAGHGKLSRKLRNPSSFTERRMAEGFLSDEYTEGVAPPRPEITRTEGQAIDNISPKPKT